MAMDAAAAAAPAALLAVAAAAAAAGGEPVTLPDPPLRAAERRLLQLYWKHLAPSREQLLRFKQAMRGLGQLVAGHDKLVASGQTTR